MLSVLALITDIRNGLVEMNETGDVTRLQRLIMKAIVAENIIQQVTQKKGCAHCPPVGRMLNEDRH